MSRNLQEYLKQNNYYSNRAVSFYEDRFSEQLKEFHNQNEEEILAEFQERINSGEYPEYAIYNLNADYKEEEIAEKLSIPVSQVIVECITVPYQDGHLGIGFNVFIYDNEKSEWENGPDIDTLEFNNITIEESHIDKINEAVFDYNHRKELEKDIKVLLAPSPELARTISAAATVEAEYGDVCIEGSKATLAHHGNRSDNPAPCNWGDVPELEDGDIILISHMDLDTIGGVQKLMGIQFDDYHFWKAAEYIDIKGPHHIQEVSPMIQDRLNAIDAWQESNDHTGRPTEVIDVTQTIKEYSITLEQILDKDNPEHDRLIEAGREWAKETLKATEERVVSEDQYVRTFKTDGVFCSAAYYSPSRDLIVPATTVLNTKFNSITVAFEDGGQDLSAREIVQFLWGNEAGGHDGIAGSPRNRIMTEQDLKEVVQLVQTLEQYHVKLSELAYVEYTVPKPLPAEMLVNAHCKEQDNQFTYSGYIVPRQREDLFRTLQVSALENGIDNAFPVSIVTAEDYKSLIRRMEEDLRVEGIHLSTSQYKQFTGKINEIKEELVKRFPTDEKAKEIIQEKQERAKAGSEQPDGK